MRDRTRQRLTRIPDTVNIYERKRQSVVTNPATKSIINQKSTVSAAAIAAIGITGVLTHTYFGRASARAKQVNCKAKEKSSKGLKLNVEDTGAAPVIGKVQREKSIDACIHGTNIARLNMLENFLNSIAKCCQKIDEWLYILVETSEVAGPSAVAKLKIYEYEYARSVSTSSLLFEYLNKVRVNVTSGCNEVCVKNEFACKLQKVVSIEQPCPALATTASSSKRKMSNLAMSEAEVVCNQKLL